MGPLLYAQATLLPPDFPSVALVTLEIVYLFLAVSSMRARTMLVNFMSSWFSLVLGSNAVAQSLSFLPSVSCYVSTDGLQVC